MIYNSKDFAAALHVVHAILQIGDVDDAERDVYEYMLTRDEIQGGVAEVNSTVRAEIAEEKCEFDTITCV